MKTKLLSLIMMITLSISLNAQQTDYCLGFDGVASRVKYVNDSNLDALNGATDYTIELWFFPTDPDFHNRVLLKRWYQFAVTMYQNNNRRIYFTQYSNNGATLVFVNTVNNVFNLNEWNHVAIINNSNANTLRIYVNGTDVTLDDNGNPGPHTALTLEANPGNSANLYVGYGGANTVPSAYIDKVRVKKTAESLANLNHSDVMQQTYTPDADTVVLLNFNEGTGDTTMNDATSVDALLQCAGGCNEIPTWHELFTNMAVNDLNEIDFTIYPNPTEEVVKINTNENINNIRIVNLDGKVVFDADYKNINNKSIEINLRDLKQGLYLVKVTTEKGVGIQKVLIK